MTKNTRLSDLSSDYKESIPADLRETKSFQWYLDECYADPKVARHRCVVIRRPANSNCRLNGPMTILAPTRSQITGTAHL
jgi:hypothetical protein